MKYCVFSDIHGNYINLVSLFSAISQLKIDKFICLGDICNYYSDNKLVIELLERQGVDCILGNHDQLYIDDQSLSAEKINLYNYDSTLRNSKKHMEFLNSLPKKIILNENSKVLFCHGSPSDFTNDYIYPDSNLNRFEDCDFDIVFMGNTHRQFLTEFKSKIFCNVGSVGMPRDNGLLFGFVVFDSETLEISLYRKHSNKEKLLKHYSNNVPSSVLELFSREEPISYPYKLVK